MKKARDVIEPTMVVGKLKFRVRRSRHQWRLSKKTQRTRAFWQELLRRVPLPPSRFLINGRNGIVGQAENMEARRGKAVEAHVVAIEDMDRVAAERGMGSAPTQPNG